MGLWNPDNLTPSYLVTCQEAGCSEERITGERDVSCNLIIHILTYTYPNNSQTYIHISTSALLSVTEIRPMEYRQGQGMTHPGNLPYHLSYALYLPALLDQCKGSWEEAESHVPGKDKTTPWEELTFRNYCLEKNHPYQLSWDMQK